MARPKISIDPDKVAMLARIGCTTEEIASELECSKDTLERRFAAVLKDGRNRFKVSVRRQQMRLLVAGNATMGVWLGKQVLGQKDRGELEHSGTIKSRVIQVELPKKKPLPSNPPQGTA